MVLLRNSRSWEETHKAATVVNSFRGFRGSGICPLNHKDEKLKPVSVYCTVDRDDESDPLEEECEREKLEARKKKKEAVEKKAEAAAKKAANAVKKSIQKNPV